MNQSQDPGVASTSETGPSSAARSPAPPTTAPLDDAPLAGASAWRVIGASVRGASHVRTNRPNQDAIAWRAIEQSVILAVADGHGSPRYLRSHQGAKLAVQTAVTELEKFYEAHKSSTGIKRAAEELLPRTLVRSWQDAVAHKLNESPLSTEELAELDRHLPDSRAADFVATRPQRVFGATLLAAIVSPDFGLFLQLGDGDIVTVDAAGKAAPLPLIADERLIANQTTSLAGSKAWQDIRVYFQPFVQSPPAFILFATDGYANSFQDSGGLLTAATDFHTLWHTQGPDYIRRHLTSWLAQTSQIGSGDDITLGLIAHDSPVSSPASETMPQSPAC